MHPRIREIIDPPQWLGAAVAKRQSLDFFYLVGAAWTSGG
jgi:hypothetical protein